jgi:hypothetical protein
MRINLRAIFANFTFFLMVSQTQTIEGVTSLQKDEKHTVMWDLDCTLEEATPKLKEIQAIYDLSDIFVLTDNDKTYRAWCFKKVDFNTYLHILVDSLPVLDYSFFYYTVKRQKATLRTGCKKGRPKQWVVCVLKSYTVPIQVDGTVERVVYDTGVEKKGISILLGGD